MALLDDQVIPFEIAGVQSGNESSGHRKLGAARFPVTYDNLRSSKLRENFVILSRRRAPEAIEAVPTKYQAAITSCSNTLVYLTEWPTPITGNFDREFLDLPEEVLITVMRHHQKYFSVETPRRQTGAAIRRGHQYRWRSRGLIQHGNERVLRARFNDARFFWDTGSEEETRRRVQDLAQRHVPGQARHAISKKPSAICRRWSREARTADDASAERRRQLSLSKTDLTTELVKEFTELQGVIGGLYARAQGEPEEVAIAIYDHYKPVSMEDSIPRTAGRPARLHRRQTRHAARLLPRRPDSDRFERSLRAAPRRSGHRQDPGRRQTAPADSDASAKATRSSKNSLLDRVRYYFREIRGFKYDEVNAVLASGWDDLSRCRRAAGSDARRPPDAQTSNRWPPASSASATSCKQAQFERRAHAASTPGCSNPVPKPICIPGLRSTRVAASRWLRLPQALEHIASLRPKVDLFFDKVLVNAPDPAVRQNRLTLLTRMLAEFSTIADFSEIVTSS